MSRSSSSLGSRRGGQVGRHAHRPAHGLVDVLERGARVQAVEAHLAVLVEVVDTQVRDDDRRAAPRPALGLAHAGRVGAAAQVAGRGAEVDALHERPLRLAHDDEHLAGVDGDLAGAARAGQPGPRRRVVADDGRVDVAEAVDLGGAQEAHVDAPTLQVVAEEVGHGHHGQGAGDDGRIADGERQPGRLGTVGAGLVDELQLGGHGVEGQVDRDVGQPDAHEADPLAGQLAGRGRDHHLVAAVAAVGPARRGRPLAAHRYSP